MNMHPEQQYIDILKEVLEKGIEKSDRTGVGIIELFGRSMRFDLTQEFPLLTTKKVPFKSVVHELLWFLRGDTNIKYLHDNKVTIWDEWAVNGEVGPMYGKQFTRWSSSNGEINQIKKIIEEIKTNPNSRRLVVSAWNVGELDQMALYPCHGYFQFNVSSNKLSCAMYQRSADLFLGVPFNIASYALLTMMVAQVCNLQPGEFIHHMGSAHVYLNHIDQVKQQIAREPRKFPTVTLNSAVTDVFKFEQSDFTLNNYDPHPKIPAPIAI